MAMSRTLLFVEIEFRLCPTLVTLTLKLATFQAWNPGYHSIEASPQHPLWGVGVCGRAGVGVLSTGGPLYLLKLGALSGSL